MQGQMAPGCRASLKPEPWRRTPSQGARPATPRRGFRAHPGMVPASWEPGLPSCGRVAPPKPCWQNRTGLEDSGGNRHGSAVAVAMGPVDRHLVNQQRRQVEPAEGSQADLLPPGRCHIRLRAVGGKPGLTVVAPTPVVTDVRPSPGQEGIARDVGSDADPPQTARSPPWSAVLTP